jgi:quercetin dioxygenase-like cupin family protein
MFFRFPQDFKKRVMPSDPESEFWMVWGERTMLCYSKIKPNSRSPRNSHPHEQAGIVIEGELTLTIGQEKRLCKK